MSKKTDPGYGYRLINTKTEAFTKEADVWDDGGRNPYWAKTGNRDQYSPTMAYRIKIQPPAGYEIVPENEQPKSGGMHMRKSINSTWTWFNDSFAECSGTRRGKTAGDLLRDYNYRAFARPIEVKDNGLTGQPLRAGRPRKKASRLTLPTGYGYRLVLGDESLVLGDECNSVSDNNEGWLVSKWQAHGYTTPDEVNTRSQWRDIVFRRKIDVNEGYRIVELKERLEQGDEGAYVDLVPRDKWFPVILSIHRTVKDYVHGRDNVIVRRKVDTTPKLTSAGEGYRLLTVGEVVKQGDDKWIGPVGEWRGARKSVGHTIDDNDKHQYRRKATPVYRILTQGEVIQRGDQVRYNGRYGGAPGPWNLCDATIGNTVSIGLSYEYRRKVGFAAWEAALIQWSMDNNVSFISEGLRSAFKAGFEAGRKAVVK